MKRFSNVFFITLGLLALVLIFAVFFYNKQSGNQSNNVSSDSAKIQQIEGLVLTDSNFVLKQTEKPDMYILGKSYRAKYTDLAKLISETAGPLMNTIASNNLIIKGSIMSVYEEMPTVETEMDIFIGIPVNQEIRGTAYFYKKVKAGKFHKISANAELGKGANIWNNVKKIFDKNGQKFSFPLIEYPSDARNSEMTTAITQVNLLIPIK